jgi:hypothetical protein
MATIVCPYCHMPTTIPDPLPLGWLVACDYDGADLGRFLPKTDPPVPSPDPSADRADETVFVYPQTPK